ncbi:MULTISPECIES: hypothetical protein [Enterobacteriaceae]|uniref:Uncharacterized protein n=1 Tax=Citrobacter freundii TaxID=546 RepID=A0AAD2SGA9_CITFR|nr:hypothetical protein [Citrobacter freundii]EKU8525540.1 hypothetical protein [Citrobacter freundii]EKU8676477.1 hypothetical protein [Citrobacter freundii]EKX6719312.1 hypothetical protein [Citrobacter freundii]MCO5744115.1 hypothetical protein [Citrobacter freundii]MCO5750673.1 hypothetical protein [Citrobacter freundii]
MFKLIGFLFKIITSFIKFILWCIFGGVKKNKKTSENIRSDYKEEFVISSNESALPSQAEDIVITPPKSTQKRLFGSLFEKNKKKTECVSENNEKQSVKITKTYAEEFIEDLRSKKTGYDKELDSYIDDIALFVDGYNSSIILHSELGREYCFERLNAIIHIYCLKRYINPMVIFFPSYFEKCRDLFDVAYIDKMSNWQFKGHYKNHNESSKVKQKFSLISHDIFNRFVHPDLYFNCSAFGRIKYALCMDRTAIYINGGEPEISIIRWENITRLSFDEKVHTLSVNSRESGIIFDDNGRELIKQAVSYFKKINNMPQNKIISRLDISINDAYRFKEKYGEDLSRLFS